MLDLIRKPTLPRAWAAVAAWVFAYALLKAFSLDGLDIDSAEQVYFAQSWQMGYGTRQPPLYTWLLLWLKPVSMSWMAALEIARYACLLMWLGGIQALARAVGADKSVQARVLLAHLGLLLVMWRVHDSLTHTVLAAGITVWASVALIKALRSPPWWALVGVLAALACLSKLNAALWCASSLVSALIVIVRDARPDRPALKSHLPWLALGFLAFIAVIAPYAHWWLTQPSGSVALAQRIVVSSDSEPFWKPVLRVVQSSLEYLLLAPLLLALMARRVDGGRTAWLPKTAGGHWLACQTVCGLLILAVVVTLMHASHFTPRWLWPVIPGFTVWMSVRAFETLDGLDDGAAWRWRANVLVWLLALASIAVAALRLQAPAWNAQHCVNCWTDRPAPLLSADLHRRHGPGPLRIITGDDHLAGILSEADARDSTWTANSVDLPPPADFARDRSPCVAAWVSMDRPQDMPTSLRYLHADKAAQAAISSTGWPMRLAPQRRIWLQSMPLRADICDKARQ